MTKLRIAPTGSKHAKGYKDRTRCVQYARERLSDLRHDMDVSRDDIAPDLPTWNRVIQDLGDLMFAAYARNHTVE